MMVAGTREFRQRLITLLVAIIAFALVPVIAVAQDAPDASPVPDSGSDSTPVFVLEPVDQTTPYFSISAKPGTTEDLKVVLGNAGEGTVAARTYAADVYTLVNGGFGIETDGEPTSAPTTWLDYAPDSLDLKPNERITRSFEIAIPDDAEPGQYITGIVLQTAEPIAIGESTMLRQTIAKAIAVLITVPGPVTPKLTIGEATLTRMNDTDHLEIAITNDGNVLLKPAGEVTVSTAAGEEIVRAPVAMGSVYAGMSTVLEISIPTTLPVGDYLVDISLEDPDTKTKAEASDLALEVAEQPEVTPQAAPVTIDAVVIDPVVDPASKKLQVANITVTLGNTGAPVPSARLTLRVTRDGELVEDFPLNSSLVVPSGTTEIQQRYLPITGWTPGTYQFSVILEAVDASSGQTTVLATVDAETTVTAS